MCLSWQTSQQYDFISDGHFHQIRSLAFKTRQMSSYFYSVSTTTSIVSWSPHIDRSVSFESASTCTPLSKRTVIDDVSQHSSISSSSTPSSSSSCFWVQQTGSNPTGVCPLSNSYFFILARTFKKMWCTEYATSAVLLNSVAILSKNTEQNSWMA